MEEIILKKLIYIGFLILLAACSGNNPEADAPAKENGAAGSNEHSVSIMLDWYPNAVHSYLYVAEEKGYFAEEGVEVDIQFPANPTDPLNLAAAGKITLGLYYQPDVIMARANEGVPVISVASIVRTPLNHLIFLEDKELFSPIDLVGKKVGYPGIPLNEALIETMVTYDGGSYDEVQLIDVGFELGSAIVSEHVDAVSGAFINHEVPVLKHLGYQTKNFNPVEYGVPSYHEIVLVTNDETWEQENEAIQAFWRAAVKGYEFMKENPDEALDILFANQDEVNFPLNEQVEKESLSILLPKMEEEDMPFGVQTEQSWEEVQNWLYEMGLITKILDAHELFRNME